MTKMENGTRNDQGFFFAKPQPAKDTLALIRSGKTW